MLQQTFIAALTLFYFTCAHGIRSFCSCVACFLGRLLQVDLIKPVSNVRPYVHPSIRQSTKSFFDFNKIWYVGRGRRVMHDGMQYDAIQGQG